jgi:hypothetical protein
MKGGWRWALPEDAHQGTEDTEDAQLASAASSADPKGTFGEDARDVPEDASHENGAPSAPSGRAWRITRPSGETFTVCAVQSTTLAELREQYPGAHVEPRLPHD